MPPHSRQLLLLELTFVGKLQKFFFTLWRGNYPIFCGIFVPNDTLIFRKYCFRSYDEVPSLNAIIIF